MDTVIDGEEEGKGMEVDEDVSENQTYTINVGDFVPITTKSTRLDIIILETSSLLPPQVMVCAFKQARYHFMSMR